MTEPVQRNFSRRRAATLAAVYLLMVLHLVHWKVFGKTLAPLELNEVMYTLELGIITAGFIFMAAAVLATLIFGRFFCSWGCHILALEDLAAWLLARLRIRPKPVRSRMLRWVPLFAMLYMFAWPQVRRLAAGQPLPELHLRSDAQGWASFLTSDFWRNLPTPAVAVLTFAVCGFAIVYLLGSRAFCAYACPYGAVFRIADRFAPGRIVARGDCSQCGRCTAVCQSGVRVHHELTVFGHVVNPACLKDLDCVAACPQGNVAYGFTRPSVLTMFSARRVPPLAYDFSRAEDALMAGAFLAMLVTFRGLYDAVPFLLSLAAAGMLAYVAVVAVRLLTRPHAALNNVVLRRHGRMTRAGGLFAAACALLLAFVAHSATIRYHEFQADRLLEEAQRAARHAPIPSESPLMNKAATHIEYCRRWGLLRPVRATQRLAWLHTHLARSLADRGDMSAAAEQLEKALRLWPDDAPTRYNLGVVLATLGRRTEAIAQYERALELDPDDADVLNNLGLLLAARGELDRARRSLERAIQLKPEYAHSHFNLGRVLLMQGRPGAAAPHLRTAARLEPRFAAYVSQLESLPAAGPSADR